MESVHGEKVRVVSGCYTGKAGIVTGVAPMQDTDQKLYTIRTKEDELIQCPSSELKAE